MRQSQKANNSLSAYIHHLPVIIRRVNIPGETEIWYFNSQMFTDEAITSSKVAMNIMMTAKVFHTCKNSFSSYLIPIQHEYGYNHKIRVSMGLPAAICTAMESRSGWVRGISLEGEWDTRYSCRSPLGMNSNSMDRGCLVRQTPTKQTIFSWCSSLINSTCSIRLLSISFQNKTLKILDIWTLQ